MRELFSSLIKSTILAKLSNLHFSFGRIITASVLSEGKVASLSFILMGMCNSLTCSWSIVTMLFSSISIVIEIAFGELCGHVLVWIAIPFSCLLYPIDAKTSISSKMNPMNA